MTNKSKIQEDFETARDTYLDLIEKGQEALELTMRIAVSTEHPRSIEALSTLLTTIANANDKLLELHRKHKDITAPSKNESRMIESNEGPDKVFLGSTSDLLKLLNKKDIDDNVIDVTPEEVDE